MRKNKIFDCITFFDNNFMFELRYNILKDVVDYFVICESKFDHKGNEKEKKFILKDYYKKEKILYTLLETPFPKNNDPWSNQAIQREFLLSYTDIANPDDYIFFSDPDEIPKPELLSNFNLKKNMEFLCKIVLIINLISLIHSSHLGKVQGLQKKKI